MEEEFLEELRFIVEKCLKNNITEFNDVLKECQGADPRTVYMIYKQNIFQSDGSERKSNIKLNYNPKLPAPNPALSQWWFTSNCSNAFARRIVERVRNISNVKVLFIGTPSLAFATASELDVTLLDIDEDVVKSFNTLFTGTNSEALVYDFVESSEKKFINQFEIVIVDPPWYENQIRFAINRAIEFCKKGGEIFCTFPCRMTRPKIENLRSGIISELIKSGHTLISLEHEEIEYIVPEFELNAFKSLEDFKSIPWRKGDLIRFIPQNNNYLETTKEVSKIPISTFSRNPMEFRIFSTMDSSLSDGLPPEFIEDYSTNISSRKIETNPDFWSSTKVGLKVSNAILVQEILTLWSLGKNMEECIKELKKGSIANDFLELTVKKLEEYFSLWSSHSSPSVLRDSEEVSKTYIKTLTSFAIKSGTRAFSEISDGYRPTFNRDRDRIIWSNALKQLADKTQLFPSYQNDSVRRRLTHTLEVMQLASTIGVNLGLNTELIEASALAHDLGHTPFGHAGEHAIGKLFDIIHPNLGGFNHYEHGLDVVTYIESPYKQNDVNSFLGLNLTIEVLESIIKHTYFHDNNEFSSINLLNNSKHKLIIPSGFCHLEGQCVRMADKISYLISDIEDGIRLGAITIFDLLNCELFHLAPLNFSINSKESLINQYSRQRQSIIKLLMEDVIKSSTLRLGTLRIKDLTEIRNANDYMINYSASIQQYSSEVWFKLQTSKLFNNSKVLNSNLLAAKIVSELIILFTIIPELIEDTFRQNYGLLMNTEYITFYEKKVGKSITINSRMLGFIPFHLLIGTSHKPFEDIRNVPVRNLICSKDYVASLTDYMARKLHKELILITQNN